jgi:ER-bound oxygenase mpaB/B'/Rubber oxygenase, catalytic domain
MSCDRWTDHLLDKMRQHGDPVADEAVAALFASGKPAAVERLMKTLVENAAPPPESLPAELEPYFDATGAIEAGDLPQIALGERLFADHGPEIIMLLGCYSLPSAYAGRKGVQVLYRTAYLAKRPNRRLCETAQMIVDVMTPGGLAPNGRGIRTAQKVRLMHAAIRHLLRHDPRRPWDPDFDVPINQEDLVGTLLTMSYLTLVGLQKIGVDVPREAQEAYLDAWRVVGRIMGVEPVLLPADMSEAAVLFDRISQRQFVPCEEGRLMTRALLDGIDINMIPFTGVAPALMRFFLPPKIADGLGVPKNWLDGEIARWALYLVGYLDSLLLESKVFACLVRTFSLKLIQWMITVDHGGRPGFAMPTALQERWGLAKGQQEASFWQQLTGWALARI